MAHNSSYTRFLHPKASAVILVFSTLIVIGCGHSHAATKAVPMSTVMDAIVKYGQGQSYATAATALTPPLNNVASPVQDVPELVFGPHMKSLLMQERFVDLEAIAVKARAEKSRHSGGVWVINDFYESVASPLGPSPSANDWNDHILLINKWIAAYPQSVTPHIALATAFASRAWSARGDGYANTVDDKSWSTFYENMAQAKSAGLEAASLKDKDPYWYDLMMQISMAEGWEPAQEQILFDQATTFEPTYYHYYRHHALYLLPRWYGKEGEVEAFAEQTLKRLPEPTASMMYFDIVSSYTCGCVDDQLTLHGASWAKLKEGYGNLVRLYGVSDLKANRYAYLTYAANDKAAAQETFTQLGDNYVRGPWENRMQFETARTWALNP
jgi:hypothetical protein